MNPEIFGKFRIIRKLAGGGMGRVYLAYDTEANRQVALKLVDVMPDVDTQEVLDAERRGAILQARLCGIDHRVAMIYDIGEQGGYLYIAMEYVEGRDLSEMITAGPLPPDDAVSIASGICGVLVNAHTFRAVLDEHEYQGIVHGDIKPRNVRITPQGEVKVLDFGIAKALSMTRKFTHNQFGSVSYSSPERLNTGEVDAASDVWSAGVVLYEMLVGHPYFEADTISKLEHQIRTYKVLGNSFEKIPPSLRGILGKALDPDPQRRYPSARELQIELDKYQRDEGRTARISNGNGADLDATRRTYKPTGLGDEKTRRTPPPLSPKVAPKTVPVSQPVTTQVPKKRSRIATLVRLGVLIVVGLVLWTQSKVWSEGSQLERDLQTERLTDVNTAWDRYQSIAQRSYLPGALIGPRSALKAKLVSIADRVINEYRDTDTLTVYLKDWQRAQASLARALELSPGDKDVRGRLRLCEGHISRINAGAVQGKSWNDARLKFEEARELMPKSPDPHLGLAQLYVIGGKEPEKATDELHEAERQGHAISKKEKTQLAEGFRVRGEELLQDAGKVPSTAQQSEYLSRADKDFVTAEDLYRDIVPYGRSIAMLRRIYEDRDAAAQRKQALAGRP